MPQYHFEVDDGTHRATFDSKLNGPEAAREAVLASLPDMARDTMPNGDQRVMTVKAVDEAGRTVYSATLTLEGQWGSGV